MKDRLAGARTQIAAFGLEPDVPVLAGPWLGEVGFELLYWLPFLRWVVRESPGLRVRLVALSRGGVSPWYMGIADRYIDLFDLFPLREFRARFPKFLKQTLTYDDYARRKYAAGEQELIELVARETGAPRLNVLHPSLMFQYFKFLHDVDEKGIAAFYPAMAPPPLGALEGQLPTEYIAVRFYESYALPATDGNLSFVQSLLDCLGGRVPIVLLNTGMSIDRKHPDFPLPPRKGVVTLEALMTPANNLAVQSAIVSRARAYVGNYGGLSYLAPYYRTPSYTIYSESESVKTNHRTLAGLALDKPNLGGYWVGSVNETTPDAVASLVLSHVTSAGVQAAASEYASPPAGGQRVSESS